MADIPQTYRGKALRHSWMYCAPGGSELGIVARYNGSDGTKDVVPYFKRNGSGWALGGPGDPRPLFGLDHLVKNQDKPVTVVEGEKCAAALQSLGWTVVTSLGGSNAAHKANWAPLEGRRKVYLLPDNDTPGMAYMRAVWERLRALDDPPEVLIVDLPGLPEKGDVVDWLQAQCPDWDGYAPIPASEHKRVISELWSIAENARPVPAEWQEGSPTEWREIVPLPERGDLGEAAPFPVEILPAAIRDACLEVARFDKVPAASPAIVGLSCLATAIGKRATVEERKGLEHFAALFFAGIAASGERKTPVVKRMTCPLKEWAESKAQEWELLKQRAIARNRAIDVQLKDIVKNHKSGNLDVAEQAILDLERQRRTEPPRPRLFTTDATEQRLFQMMHERDGAFAVLSGEGRPVLDAIMGKYSGDGRTGDAIYLAGISGDTITRDRVGSEKGAEDRVIHHPCLNVCVLVQSDKYMEAASHPALRASGALARIWAVWLPTMVGSRIEAEDETGLSASAMGPYNNLLRRILGHVRIAEDDEDGESGNEPHVASLSPSAARSRREFHNEVERLMAEGEDLEDVRDIASKAVSQTCKLALVLHIAEDPTVLDEQHSEISPETWARAQTLGTWFLTEAVRVQRQADEYPALKAGRQVVRWIQRERRETFTGSELMQYGPRPRLNARAAEAVLSLLEDHNMVKAERVPGRKKPIYRVNPNLLSQVSRFSQRAA
jgi:hypothetical protein